MSDKLQKTEGAIEVAGNIGEAVERIVSQDETPAKIAERKFRLPGALDKCACGHESCLSTERSPVTSARGSRLIKPGSYTLVLETIDENAETITATIKETGETVEIPNPLRALRRPKP